MRILPFCPESWPVSFLRIFLNSCVCGSKRGRQQTLDYPARKSRTRGHAYVDMYVCIQAAEGSMHATSPARNNVTPQLRKFCGEKKPAGARWKNEKKHPHITSPTLHSNVNQRLTVWCPLPSARSFSSIESREANPRLQSHLGSNCVEGRASPAKRCSIGRAISVTRERGIAMVSAGGFAGGLEANETADGRVL